MAFSLGRADASLAGEGSLPTSLEVVTAAGCPSPQSVEEEIRWRAPGANLVAGAAQRLRIVIVAEGAGYVATLTYERPDQASEPRQLRANRCDDLAGAVALIAAMTVDPDAVTGAMEPLESPPKPLEPALTPPTEPAPPLRQPVGRGEPNVAVTVGAQLAFGTAPRRLPQLAVAVERRLTGRWSVELGTTVGYVATAASGEQAASVFVAALANPRGCGRASRVVEAQGCAGLAIGWLRASVQDQPRATAADRLWMAVTARVAIRYPAAGRWFAQVSADLAAPLTRDEFVVTPGTLVHQPAALVPSVGLALGLRR